MSPRSEAWRRAVASADREWQNLPRLPGTHLSYRRLGFRSWQISDANGSVWATLDARRTSVAAARSFIYSTRFTAEIDGQIYVTRRTGDRFNYLAYEGKRFRYEVVDEAGVPALELIGLHYHGAAHTQIQTPDRRRYLFPVSGVELSSAVMHAIEVDGSGQSMISYRKGPKSIEIVVPQVRLLAAVSSQLLPSYFYHPREAPERGKTSSEVTTNACQLLVISIPRRSTLPAGSPTAEPFRTVTFPLTSTEAMPTGSE
jgi:hypothetical protein